MGEDPNVPVEATTERRSGPRTSVVLLVTLAVILVLGGAAVGAAIWMDRTSDDDSDDEALPATTADDSIDVEPIGGGTANRLFARRTEAGVDIRVHETDDPMFGGGGFGADPDAPEWCQSETVAVAHAVSPDAVATAEMPMSKVPPPDGAFNALLGGMIEGAPLYGVLAQVGEDVTMARLSVVGGGQDSMEPVGGIIALAVPAATAQGGEVERSVPADGPMRGDPWMEATQAMSVELLNGDGTSERISGNDLMSGELQPPVWSDPACFGEEPFIKIEETATTVEVALTLPPAGSAQPPDPVAAEAEVIKAFTDLHADIANPDTMFRLVDDPSGLDLLIERESASGRRKILSTTVEVTDLVFFSPIEASFVYQATVDGDEQPETYGRARLIDGTWRITRTTLCQDLIAARNGLPCPI